MIEIWKRYRFEAAHRLPKTPGNHKCHNLHGHNFTVILSLIGPVNDDGWLVDFGDITAAWNTVKAVIDHRYLNDIPGLENPTSEVLAAWIWDRMVALVPGLAAVQVQENDDCGAIYRGI
jgi:6-pyruvoyltetrahydropterin/6-carboxytetrahydropterin synthase